MQTIDEKRASKYRRYMEIYNEAPEIECGCGCGILIKSKDKYGRDKKYINGHGARKYQDPKQYKREWNHRHREQRYANKKAYGRRRKVQIIKIKGSKCVNCGLEYNGTNATVFDLHHRDPKEKKLLLNIATLQNVAFKTVIEEIDKCDLLCSNCHRIEHTSGW